MSRPGKEFSPENNGGQDGPDESWHSPFRGLAERDPANAAIYAAAEAIWVVDSAAKQQAEMTPGQAEFVEEQMEKYIQRKDDLLAGLGSDYEREMAMNHARLAVGPYEGPEVDDEIEIYETDEKEAM